MGIRERIMERVFARRLRQAIRGRKSYLTAIGGFAIAIGSLLGIEGIADLDLSDGDAVTLAVVSVLGATLRAAIAAATEGSK